MLKQQPGKWKVKIWIEPQVDGRWDGGTGVDYWG